MHLNMENNKFVMSFKNTPRKKHKTRYIGNPQNKAANECLYEW